MNCADCGDGTQCHMNCGPAKNTHPRIVECPSCRGRGYTNSSFDCRWCKGKGEVSEEDAAAFEPEGYWDETTDH